MEKELFINFCFQLQIVWIPACKVTKEFAIPQIIAEKNIWRKDRGLCGWNDAGGVTSQDS